MQQNVTHKQLNIILIPKMQNIRMQNSKCKAKLQNEIIRNILRFPKKQATKILFIVNWYTSFEQILIYIFLLLFKCSLVSFIFLPANLIQSSEQRVKTVRP